MGGPHKVGIIGLGNISAAYLETLNGIPSITVAAVADLDAARAEAVAAALPSARAVTVAELLADDEVTTVLNLTIPAAHAEVALAAIAHGKHVYGEKPLAVTLEEGRAIVDAAAAAGVSLGTAPDTVLGTGIQTARAALEDGSIGTPTAASAVMITAGHERWHPQPDFYYRAGGGPLFDMGPYYVSSLVHLLGPVRSVIGASVRPLEERLIESGPRAGERIRVEIDTHIAGILEHHGGALSTITTSFDGSATLAAPIEVHGTGGTLAAPDPNHFHGDVRVFARNGSEWRTVPASAGYADSGRGIGLLDMLESANGDGRASGSIGLHVLEIMVGLTESANAGGQRVQVQSVPAVPPLVPLTSADRWRGVPA
ncbi:Gfo/Idh/MocA family protein [Micromonospora sp. DT81.3]|uniref:Gfo/Idh/MocA family protein n=1 Tax=Actinomycetes TaxID=1760 RepID=UPI003CED40F2